MTKKYFCKYVSDYEICGETSPINFEAGRYTICKKCRNKKNRENKEKKITSMIEEKNNKIDPSCNLRHLIEDTILKIPIIHGYNIVEKFEEDDIETSNITTKMHSNFDILFKRIDCLEKYIKLLELKIDSMKK
jgi:hypothetical protein